MIEAEGFWPGLFIGGGGRFAPARYFLAVRSLPHVPSLLLSRARVQIVRRCAQLDLILSRERARAGDSNREGD